MRALCLLILLLATASVHAGALERCRQGHTGQEAVRNCVRAERARSMNMLRKISADAQVAVQRKIREARNNALLREYRTLQARHVRERNALCRRQETGIEQVACEADMNTAQIEQLTRFIE